MTVGPIVAASTAADGTQANSESSDASISADGKQVAFYGRDSNLVPDDSNFRDDIFVKDLQTGEIVIASTKADGTQSNDSSFDPSVSADGRSVVFFSFASNLVPDDTNSREDIFVKNLDSGEIARANTADDGTEANGGQNESADLSSNGRYVAFATSASNLVPDDTNAQRDVFVKDMETGEIVRASTTTDGSEINAWSYGAQISADGRTVAFASNASNLVPGDNNYNFDVFVKDLDTGEIVRASTASGGTQANGGSVAASLSDDGRHVAFESDAPNLVPDDAGFRDVFVKYLDTGEVMRANTQTNGAQANAGASSASLSGDGRYVAFESDASDLVAQDTNGKTDVFVKDLVTGIIVRVSTAEDGAEADGRSFSPSLSADGLSVSFTSEATNLLSEDTNGRQDVFVKDLSDVFPEVMLGTPENDTLSGTEHSDFIDGLGGDDSIDGLGGDDNLIGNDGADSLFGGDGFDSLSGGDGDDSLDGGAENDRLDGGEGDDTLSGGGGDDSLEGLGGDDTLVAGSGNDTLEGGDGDDLLEGGNDLPEESSDTVCVQVNFIDEDAGYRSTYGVYDTESGQAHILVANVDTVTNSGIKNFTTTLCLTPDEIDHLGFFLIPGGYDVNADAGEPLAGGDPTALDLEVFDDAGVWKIRDVDSGFVFEGRSSAAYFTEEYKNPGGLAHVLEGGDLETSGTVTQSWEDLPGLGDRDFNDVVFEVKRELVVGGSEPGDDSLVGGDGDDTVSFVGTMEGVDIDLAAGTASGTATGEDTLSGIENATGGDGDDALKGDDGANILDGGEGNDSFEVDAGNDTYEGGEGNDTLSFETTADGVTVDLGAGTALGAETGADSIRGIENVFGGDGDDRLSGDGENNVLVGGEGNDTVSFASDSAGVTADLLAGTVFGNESGIDAIDGFENVTGGEGNDTLSGDNGPNRLVGGGGKDVLRGRLANDTLVGGDGEDTLDGGDGLDHLFGGGGNDVFDFNAVWESPPNLGRDVIGDFENPGPADGDLIDVSDIAAFAFIGTGPFTGGGAELRVEQSGSHTLVAGDANGDGVADFEIQVTETAATDFTADDFVVS